MTQHRFITIASASLLLLIASFLVLKSRQTMAHAEPDRFEGVQSKSRPRQEHSLPEQRSSSPRLLPWPPGTESLNLNQMLASLDGIPNGPQHQFLLKQIADLYAETDPDKGFEWLNSLPPTLESVAAFPSFFAKLGNLDPTRAIAWVEQIKFEGGQKAAASAAATIIAFHNPAQGWELLDKWKSMIPDRVTMQARLIQSISQGPGPEVAWNIYNPKNQHLALEDTTRFFKAVRFANPKEALDFAAAKVMPNNQPSAMEAIVRNWSPTGLESVSKELAARPVEPKYDGAYAALAGRMLTTDPISAAKWSNIITDQTLKNTMQKQIRDFTRINGKATFSSPD